MRHGSLPGVRSQDLIPIAGALTCVLGGPLGPPFLWFIAYWWCSHIEGPRQAEYLLLTPTAAAVLRLSRSVCTNHTQPRRTPDAIEVLFTIVRTRRARAAATKRIQHRTLLISGPPTDTLPGVTPVPCYSSHGAQELRISVAWGGVDVVFNQRRMGGAFASLPEWQQTGTVLVRTSVSPARDALFDLRSRSSFVR